MISSVPTGIAFSSFMKHTIGWYDLESESLKASTKGLLLKKGVMSSNHFPTLDDSCYYSVCKSLDSCSRDTWLKLDYLSDSRLESSC